MNYYHFTIKDQDENDNEIAVAKIKIEIPKLIADYNKEIEYYNQYCLGKLDDDAPRHDEFRAISKIKAQLESALANNEDIDFTHDNYIYSFSGRLILNDEYHSINCIQCNETYTIDEINKEKWSTGEGLHATGGRTLYCKNKHFLYGLMEWNS